ncbi:MAG: hypothetical protein RMJ48_13720 [Roseiflexaceae bacterium]|nr:hypothetical protein [Roseiflexaceae bacterium]
MIRCLNHLLALHRLRYWRVASAALLLTRSLLAWARSRALAQQTRAAVQRTAVPAPETLPGQELWAEAVVNHWRVQQRGLDLLRQQVWGTWSAAQLPDRLPSLVRHLIAHPRCAGPRRQASTPTPRMRGAQKPKRKEEQRHTDPTPRMRGAQIAGSVWGGTVHPNPLHAEVAGGWEKRMGGCPQV